MIYLKNKETNEIINTFTNVIEWSDNFVEYEDYGRCKIYCDTETEYFTDQEETPEQEQ